MLLQSMLFKPSPYACKNTRKNVMCVCVFNEMQCFQDDFRNSPHLHTGACVCAIQRAKPWGLATGTFWWHPSPPGKAQEHSGDSERQSRGKNSAASSTMCGESATARYSF